MNAHASQSYSSLIRFFVPLGLQAASQTLTYPLVGMITSRGEGGPVNLAGLAQSNSVMFLISTLGAGLITTGMVYARDKRNYDQFLKVNYTIMAVVLFLQALFSVPPLAHLLFGTIMGLPASIEHPARLTFLASLPLQMAFFLRTPYQVVLYNHHATVK